MERSTVTGFANEYFVVGDARFRDLSRVSSVISSLYANVLIASALVVSVRFTDKTGQHIMYKPSDNSQTMASDTLSRGAGIKGIRVAIIPLSMQVIGHVDDVVNEF